VNNIVDKYICKYVQVFADTWYMKGTVICTLWLTIMIYTQKGTDHKAAVTGVLETLSKHQLWLKPGKCEFSRPEVEYLGLLISCNQLQMDPTKAKALSKWLPPKNVTELQRFTGF
jgi:hypothetical protein